MGTWERSLSLPLSMYIYIYIYMYIKDYDCVVVMEKGRVQEVGPPKDQGNVHVNKTIKRTIIRNQDKRNTMY